MVAVRVTPKSLVLDLMSAAVQPVTPVALLVRAASLFSIGGGALRVALTRLTAAGLIEAVSRGHYRLGPRARAVRDQVATWRRLEGRVRRWRGGFVGALLPPRALERRADQALRLMGMQTLEPGLAVRPDNVRGGVTDVRQRLNALGVGVPVFAVTDLDEVRHRAACALWDTAALERGYADMTTRLEAALRSRSTATREAFAREGFVLGGQAIRMLVFDPLLPEAIVDVAARRKLARTMVRFDSEGVRAWRDVLGDLGQAPVNVGRFDAGPLAVLG